MHVYIVSGRTRKKLNNRAWTSGDKEVTYATCYCLHKCLNCALFVNKKLIIIYNIGF